MTGRLRLLWARLLGRRWRCGYCGRDIIVEYPKPGRPVEVKCGCGASWTVTAWEGGQP